MSHEKSVLFLSGLLFSFIIFMVSTMVVDTFKMLNIFSNNNISVSESITSETNSIFVEDSLTINSSFIEESESISIDEPTSEEISTEEPTSEQPTTEEPTSEIINPYPVLTAINYHIIPMKKLQNI